MNSRISFLPDAIFLMIKIASPTGSSTSTAQDLMKLIRSFTVYVCDVCDVIVTSGKETSNISFQVPTVLMTLLTLSNFWSLHLICELRKVHHCNAIVENNWRRYFKTTTINGLCACVLSCARGKLLVPLE